MVIVWVCVGECLDKMGDVFALFTTTPFSHEMD